MKTISTQRPFVVPVSPRTPRRRLVKVLDNAVRRLVDLGVGFWGLLFLAPFFGFIALLIKSDSPGPIFYWGRRMGRGGREFRILKFRTMYETPASHSGPKLTARGDGRITPVGEWLRSTKLNELPQLWNVFIGEMSLVGPRPEDPDIVKKWPEEARLELLSVRPGITSPASVVYRDEEALLTGGNIMDEYLRSILPTKLRFDQVYVRNRNIFNDLDVIFWTLVVLIPQARREKIPEARLYWGPLSGFFAHDFRWFVVDFFVALLCITIVGVIWRTITPLHVGWQFAPVVAFLMALVFGLSNALRGLNRVYWAKASPSEALDLLLTSGIATSILWFSNQYVLRTPAVPVGLFIFGGLFAYLGFVAVRYRERLLTGMATRWLQLRNGGRILGERMLIVGAGDLGQFATWLVRKGNLSQAFSIVGLVDDDPRKHGMRMDGAKVLGSTADIQKLVEQHDIGIVLFAISNIEPQARSRIITMCDQLSVRTVHIPNVVMMMQDEFRSDPLTRTPVSKPTPKELVRRLHQVETLLEEKKYDDAQAEIVQMRADLLSQ